MVGITSCSFPSLVWSTPTPTLMPTSTSTSTLTPTSTPVPTLTPTPTKVVIKGIDEPLVIDGVDITISEIKTSKNIQFGTNTFAPQAPYNLLLQIEATSSQPQSICGWKGEKQIELEYQHNGKKIQIPWGICISNSSTETVRIIFATFEGVENFSLLLPYGNKIPILLFH